MSRTPVLLGKVILMSSMIAHCSAHLLYGYYIDIDEIVIEQGNIESDI